MPAGRPGSPGSAALRSAMPARADDPAGREPLRGLPSSTARRTSWTASPTCSRQRCLPGGLLSCRRRRSTRRSRCRSRWSIEGRWFSSTRRARRRCWRWASWRTCPGWSSRCWRPVAVLLIVADGAAPVRPGHGAAGAAAAGHVAVPAAERRRVPEPRAGLFFACLALYATPATPTARRWLGRADRPGSRAGVPDPRDRQRASTPSTIVLAGLLARGARGAAAEPAGRRSW